MTRYPAYKSSGVDWLGDIPVHWEVRRLRFLALINPSKQEVSKFARDTEVSFLPMEAIGDDGSFNLEQIRRISEVEEGYTFIRDRDVGVAKITPCFENGKGALFRGLVNTIGFGTTELTILRCTKALLPEFLYYLTYSSEFRKPAESWMYGAGGQKRVPDDYFRNYPVALPPLDEQAAIVSYIDCELAQIDELIATQETLIERLREKRTALISHVVTKGLNPDAPMRDSGIGWLGDIPAHWGMRRLKYVTRFLSGGTPSKENLAYWSGTIPWVSPKDMKSEQITDTEDHVTLDAVNSSATSYLSKSTILMVVRSGILQHTIPVAINAIPVTINQDIKALLFDERIVLNWYFLRWVQGFQKDLIRVWTKQGATVESVEHEYLINTLFTSPPLHEQAAIVMYLDDELTRFDQIEREAHTIIITLKERRAALITLAVTGKIDVRTSPSIQPHESAGAEPQL